MMNTLPPGLFRMAASQSEPESSTQSRERRRVALACREISEGITSKLDDMALKINVVIEMVQTLATTVNAQNQSMEYLHKVMMAHARLRNSDNFNSAFQEMESRMERLETLLVTSPLMGPSVDEVLSNLMPSKQAVSSQREQPVHDASFHTKSDSVPSTPDKKSKKKEKRPHFDITSGDMIDTADLLTNESSTISNALPKTLRARCEGRAVQTEIQEYATELDVQDRSDEEKLSQQHAGEWISLDSSAKLEVGDVIKLVKQAETLNPPIVLSRGLCGVVRCIDDDGDLMGFFPEAPSDRYGEHWLDRSACKMMVLKATAQVVSDS